jgi:hypothetical protein
MVGELVQQLAQGCGACSATHTLQLAQLMFRQLKILYTLICVHCLQKNLKVYWFARLMAIAHNYRKFNDLTHICMMAIMAVFARYRKTPTFPEFVDYLIATDPTQVWMYCTYTVCTACKFI